MNDGLVPSFRKVRLWLCQQIAPALISYPENRQLGTGSTYVIGRNGDGVPEFPIMDLQKDGLDVVKSVLEGYFNYLWGTCLYQLKLLYCMNHITQISVVLVKGKYHGKKSLRALRLSMIELPIQFS